MLVRYDLLVCGGRSGSVTMMMYQMKWIRIIMTENARNLSGKNTTEDRMKTELVNKLTWEDIKEIDEALRALSEKFKLLDDDDTQSMDEEYYSEVIRRLHIKYKTLPACRDRYKEILPVAEHIVGEKNRKERTFELTVLRCMVANKLREEGYTISDIGRVMRYDHSTVSFYLSKKADFLALPLMYEREVRWFNAFDAALKNGGD